MITVLPHKSIAIVLLTLFTFFGSSVIACGKPNIVLFVADDHGLHAGCYGTPNLKTPSMDALAADGVRFTRAYAVTASCSPSRATILTGRYPHSIGQYGLQHASHHFQCFGDVVSLPNLLSEAGYRTALCGKLHVGPPQAFTFDNVISTKKGNPVAMADSCREYVEEESDRPFFLYFCTSDPHRSKPYRGESELQPNRFGNNYQQTGVSPQLYSPSEVTVPSFLPDTSECHAELSQYYQSVSRVDQGLGRLMQILRDANVYQDTVIVYISDHGIAMPGAKTTLYEPGLHVPCIIRAPDMQQRGFASDALVSWVDIAPTLGSYAGTEEETMIDGVSFRSVIHGDSDSVRERVFGSHTHHEITMYYPMRSVREQRFKLIWNLAHQLPFPFAKDLWDASTWQAQLRKGEDAPYGFRTVGQLVDRPEFELFDLETDPEERRNLATEPEYASDLQRLKTTLREHQDQTNDPWIIKWNRE